MRDILIATHIADAWGTADMKPDDSREGQSSWGNKVTDNLAYLYWQMLQDKWVIEAGAYQYNIPDDWGLVGAWYVYYNGVASMLFSYMRVTSGAEAHLALTLGDVAIGTTYLDGGGSTQWPESYLSVSPDIPAGEYRLKLYAKVLNGGDPKVSRVTISTLPTGV